MTNATLTIVIVLAIIVLAVIGAVAYRVARQKRTEKLREQYGPEYDRTLRRTSSQRAAETELRERMKRHSELKLRTLDQGERDGFERRWADLQGQFVDDPGRAVSRADRLVVDIMSARGYPVDDFDRQADDLSVRYPEVTQRYREARKIAKANEDGSADTEVLRHAVTSYRSLIHALVTDGDQSNSGDQGDPESGERAQAAERGTTSS
ncbi:MAG: hypothetical protein JO100_00635 [Pseudonocardia sp.]|nr:hypothetical protein [Pseudonocardia sp.]